MMVDLVGLADEGEGEGLAVVGRVIVAADLTALARGRGCLPTGMCLSLSTSTSIASVLAMTATSSSASPENDSCRSSSLLDQSMPSIASPSSFSVSLPVHIDGDGDGDIATLVAGPASVFLASVRVRVPVLPGLRASRTVYKSRESLRTDFGVAYGRASSSSSSSPISIPASASASS